MLRRGRSESKHRKCARAGLGSLPRLPASCRAPRNAALCQAHSGCYRAGGPRAEAFRCCRTAAAGTDPRPQFIFPRSRFKAPFVRLGCPSFGGHRTCGQARAPVEGTIHARLARPMQLRVAAYRRIPHTVALMSMHALSSRVGIALLHAGPYRSLLNQGSNPSVERTSNGGPRLFAPERSATPLAAAHLKR